MSTLLRVSLTALAATLALVPTTVSSARTKNLIVTATRPDAGIPVRHIAFRDLNLSNPSGERALMWRVRSAAGLVCYDSGWDQASFDGRTGFSRCRFNAISNARPQIEAAVRRAREVASTGHSLIAAAAITVAAAN